MQKVLLKVLQEGQAVLQVLPVRPQVLQVQWPKLQAKQTAQQMLLRVKPVMPLEVKLLQVTQVKLQVMLLMHIQTPLQMNQPQVVLPVLPEVTVKALLIFQVQLLVK